MRCGIGAACVGVTRLTWEPKAEPPNDPDILGAGGAFLSGAAGTVRVMDAGLEGGGGGARGGGSGDAERRETGR